MLSQTDHGIFFRSKSIVCVCLLLPRTPTKQNVYSTLLLKAMCVRSPRGHKGHRTHLAGGGHAKLLRGEFPQKPNQRAAKTNSGWSFASCLRSPWPASRQQPRDPRLLRGRSGEETRGPPTGYKTRGRRKHSDSRHTWSKEPERAREGREERHRDTERERDSKAAATACG